MTMITHLIDDHRQRAKEPLAVFRFRPRRIDAPRSLTVARAPYPPAAFDRHLDAEVSLFRGESLKTEPQEEREEPDGEHDTAMAGPPRFDREAP